MDKTRSECLLCISSVKELLDGLALQLEAIRLARTSGGHVIRRVEDLQPIFASRTPTEYLIEPEYRFHGHLIRYERAQVLAWVDGQWGGMR